MLDVPAPVWVFLASVITAIAGAYAARYQANRKTSGRVDTTEAETLWTQAQAMRSEMRDELVALRSECVSLRADAVSLRADSVVQREQLAVVQDHSKKCDRELAALRRRIKSLGA